MERRFAQYVLRLLEGDITCYRGDALVNAANNHLWMGTGVAGANKRCGGEVVERDAMARGPIPVGEVVETSGGLLDVSYVLHAAVMGQDLRTDARIIATATANCLDLAEALHLHHIAFPAFGTGVGGFPVPQCARIMLWTVGEHMNAGSSTIHEVCFCLFTRHAFRVFALELEHLEGQLFPRVR